MQRFFESKAAFLTVCALFTMALLWNVGHGSTGFLHPHAWMTSELSQIAHGASIPPDPWAGNVVAHGASIPPDPWAGNVVDHGASIPPDPWAGDFVAHGASIPPDPWAGNLVEHGASTPPDASAGLRG
jgi:hypothetical protein